MLAIEEIKKLKASYFQRLDFKDWAGLADLFTADASIDYSGHARDLIEQHGRNEIKPAPEEWVFIGGKAAVNFLSPLLADVISVHHGHDPQVTVTSPASAIGFWSLYDRLEFKDEVYHGYGHYQEAYRLVDGRWLISGLVLTRHRSVLALKPAAR
ncbi:MAG: nuclear transport factor 2 family protein [Gammaproteobacteria bacterium]|nr:nuclear transport factor 2 family protein [Gammaproteobacteria bacterium]